MLCASLLSSLQRGVACVCHTMLEPPKSVLPRRRVGATSSSPADVAVSGGCHRLAAVAASSPKQTLPSAAATLRVVEDNTTMLEDSPHPVLPVMRPGALLGASTSCGGCGSHGPAQRSLIRCVDAADHMAPHDILHKPLPPRRAHVELLPTSAAPSRPRDVSSLPTHHRDGSVELAVESSDRSSVATAPHTSAIKEAIESPMTQTPSSHSHAAGCEELMVDEACGHPTHLAALSSSTPPMRAASMWAPRSTHAESPSPAPSDARGPVSTASRFIDFGVPFRAAPPQIVDVTDRTVPQRNSTDRGGDRNHAPPPIKQQPQKPTTRSAAVALPDIIGPWDHNDPKEEAYDGDMIAGEDTHHYWPREPAGVSWGVDGGSAATLNVVHMPNEHPHQHPGYVAAYPRPTARHALTSAGVVGGSLRVSTSSWVSNPPCGERSSSCRARSTGCRKKKMPKTPPPPSFSIAARALDKRTSKKCSGGPRPPSAAGHDVYSASLCTPSPSLTLAPRSEEARSHSHMDPLLGLSAIERAQTMSASFSSSCGGRTLASRCRVRQHSATDTTQPIREKGMMVPVRSMRSGPLVVGYICVHPATSSNVRHPSSIVLPPQERVLSSSMGSAGADRRKMPTDSPPAQTLYEPTHTERVRACSARTANSQQRQQSPSDCPHHSLNRRHTDAQRLLGDISESSSSSQDGMEELPPQPLLSAPPQPHISPPPPPHVVPPTDPAAASLPPPFVVDERASDGHVVDESIVPQDGPPTNCGVDDDGDRCGREGSAGGSAGCTPSNTGSPGHKKKKKRRGGRR